MDRVHHYKYVPILLGAERRYRIELPLGASPIVYKTLTTGMRVWDGQLIQSQQGRAVTLIREATRIVTVEGRLIDDLPKGSPCIVMEHLTIDGIMEFMIGNNNILNGNQNFVNFGIPNEKHIRIDIYTGESRIING